MVRPTVEAVWLQWPTPGAPSAAIELNGKSAILCVFIFHAAFGEHSDFNSHRDPHPTTTRPSGTAARTKLLPTRALRTGDALKSASGDDPRTEAVLSPLDHRKHDPPAQVPRALLPVEDSRQEGRREQYPGATILQWCGTRKADRRPDEPQEPGGCNSESCTNNIHFFRAAGTRAKCRVPASCKIFWFEVLSIGTQFSLPSFLSLPLTPFSQLSPWSVEKRSFHSAPV